MNDCAKTQTTVAALRNACKRYGAVTAVDRVTLDIHRGEALALLGPNGAGKTTIVNLLLGLAWPTSGTVELFGLSPREVAGAPPHRRHAARRAAWRPRTCSRSH